MIMSETMKSEVYLLKPMPSGLTGTGRDTGIVLTALPALPALPARPCNNLNVSGS